MHAFHARDLLRDDHAFMHALMREPWRADEIADGPDAGNAGGAPYVDDDMRLLDLDAGLLVAVVLHIADDADGQDDAVDRQRFGLAVPCLQRCGNIVGAFLKLLDRGGGPDLHALLLERLGGEGGDFLVFHQQYAVQHFHHRYVTAERAVEARELDADGAGADDQKRFREG